MKKRKLLISIISIILVFLSNCMFMPEGAIVIRHCSSYALSDYTYGVSAIPGYAFVANGENGLQIFDIRNLLEPELIGNNAEYTWARDIYTNLHNAYIVDRDDGFLLFNIDSKENPVLVSRMSMPGYSEGLFIDNGYAYIACDYSGLCIVDLSVPDTLKQVGIYNSSTYCLEGVYVKDNYAYVADYTGYLRVFDVSDNTAPVLIDSYNTGGSPVDVYIRENMLYICCREAGVYVYDCTNPEQLIQKYHYSDVGDAWSVVVNDNGYVFVAYGASGLKVLSILNNTLREVFTYNTIGYAYDVFVDGSVILLAAGREGIEIFEIISQ